MWTKCPCGPQPTRNERPSMRPASTRLPSLPAVIDVGRSTREYLRNERNGFGSTTGVAKFGRACAGLVSWGLRRRSRSTLLTAVDCSGRPSVTLLGTQGLSLPFFCSSLSTGTSLTGCWKKLACMTAVRFGSSLSGWGAHACGPALCSRAVGRDEATEMDRWGKRRSPSSEEDVDADRRRETDCDCDRAEYDRLGSRNCRWAAVSDSDPDRYESPSAMSRSPYDARGIPSSPSVVSSSSLPSLTVRSATVPSSSLLSESRPKRAMSGGCGAGCCSRSSQVQLMIARRGNPSQFRAASPPCLDFTAAILRPATQSRL